MNVLIVDDHPLFRRGLCDYFANGSDYEVVAQAGNGEEAIICLRDADIDVVLLDIDLPIHSGFDLLSVIRHDYPQIKVVMLTLHDELAYAQRAFDLGASAYLLKDDTEELLEECLHKIDRGERFCSLGDIESSDGDDDPLSDAERQVFSLVGSGKSSAEIAALLSVSVRTIDNHRASIAKKFGLRGTNALLKYAIQQHRED